jgi:hypothetical protein
MVAGVASGALFGKYCGPEVSAKTDTGSSATIAAAKNNACCVILIYEGYYD